MSKETTTSRETTAHSAGQKSPFRPAFEPLGQPDNAQPRIPPEQLDSPFKPLLWLLVPFVLLLVYGFFSG